MTHIREENQKHKHTDTTGLSSGKCLIHKDITRIENARQPGSIQNSYEINTQNCKK
jgi:hypothetical protein